MFASAVEVGGQCSTAEDDKEALVSAISVSVLQGTSELERR